MIKYKLKASIIHLGLSLLLVSFIIGGLLYFFFPSLFIGVSDFKDVAIMIIAIDLVLGPLLTFVVYQPKKKSLKFDLSVIAAIQLSALAYGAFALFQIHPVYIAFNVDRFTIVTAKDAEPEKVKHQALKISKFGAGKLTFAKMPEDKDKKNEVTLRAAYGGEDLEQREEYYEPIEENLSQIIAKSLDPELIFKDSDSQQAQKFLSKNKKNLDNFAYLPLNSMKKDAIIVIDKKTAEPVATFDIDPWTLSKTGEI